MEISSGSLADSIYLFMRAPPMIKSVPFTVDQVFDPIDPAFAPVDPTEALNVNNVIRGPNKYIEEYILGLIGKSMDILEKGNGFTGEPRYRNYNIRFTEVPYVLEVFEDVVSGLAASIGKDCDGSITEYAVVVPSGPITTYRSSLELMAVQIKRVVAICENHIKKIWDHKPRIAVIATLSARCPDNLFVLRVEFEIKRNR